MQGSRRWEMGGRRAFQFAAATPEPASLLLGTGAMMIVRRAKARGHRSAV